MIGIQTTALLVDAYRELNARKMFWIVLILSGLAIGSFAIVGVSGNTISIFGLKPPTFGVPALVWYKVLFQELIIGIWLTWAATILALISTSSIFPDLISGGSIDLFLSKPLSRVRLFLTKYFSGLLFVFLQVLLFSVISYFVLGIRGGFWKPAVFWAIPIVLCFFSYLFAVCVLIGVLTRSTLAALLLTILFWLVCFAVGTTEVVLLQMQNMAEEKVQSSEQQLAAYDANISRLADHPPATTNPAQRMVDDFRATRQRIAVERDEAIADVQRWKKWHRISYWTKTIVPKTGDTIDLLGRSMLTEEEMAELSNSDDGPGNGSASSGGRSQPNRPREDGRRRRSEERKAAEAELHTTLRKRSLSWVIGSSLAFEAVVLALAAWVFCRRDF